MWYGRADRMTWDPGRLEWEGQILFTSYTAKVGRKLLLKRHELPNRAAQTRGGMLPPTFKLKWTNV